MSNHIDYLSNINSQSPKSINMSSQDSTQDNSHLVFTPDNLKSFTFNTPNFKDNRDHKYNKYTPPFISNKNFYKHLQVNIDLENDDILSRQLQFPSPITDLSKRRKIDNPNDIDKLNDQEIDDNINQHTLPKHITAYKNLLSHINEYKNSRDIIKTELTEHESTKSRILISLEKEKDIELNIYKDKISDIEKKYNDELSPINKHIRNKKIYLHALKRKLNDINN